MLLQVALQVGTACTQCSVLRTQKGTTGGYYTVQVGASHCREGPAGTVHSTSYLVVTQRILFQKFIAIAPGWEARSGREAASSSAWHMRKNLTTRTPTGGYGGKRNGGTHFQPPGPGPTLCCVD